jgi:hypothetical protein
MSAPTDRPVYLLKLRPEPGPVPEMVRLRRCLKQLLRCYGLVCLSVEEVKVENRPDAGHEPQDPSRAADDGATKPP